MNTEIWQLKYKSTQDKTPEDTFRRVAKAISKGDTALEEEFFTAMSKLKFIPGGRILSYAGTGNPKATLANCYVMGEIEDSMEGIMKSLHESALTLKAGGGIGLNFSTLRPEGEPVKGTASAASGPVSFMEIWNATSRTISGVNQRKGAMIGVLNIDHPDIEKFIFAKRNNSKETPVLEKFNISVGITDEFMQAVKEDRDFSLVFNGKEYKKLPARQLMKLIVENAWAKAEPGVLFLDTINKLNNLWYCETINATNPCGELPLPPDGACMLGAINLTQFVKDPFGEKADIDWKSLEKVVSLAVKFLDNTIDVCYYPVEAQKKQAELKRRIGLGIMGLGSALAMLKVRYGSSESKIWCQKIFEFIRDNAYMASVKLAKEKGAFPLFDKEKYLQSMFIKRLPDHIKREIEKYGIRNGCILTIAPTGSISQLADYVSSGVEPIFCLEYIRKNPNYNQEIVVQDYAWRLYKEKYPDADIKTKPEFFVTAMELTWQEHIDVMSVCQYYIDSSISKTINLPKNINLQELEDVYFYAWGAGLKGCTIYREASLDEILKPKKEDNKPAHVVSTQFTRPYKLEGKTYKVKVPDSRHAYYITFTYDPEIRKPVEMFINTKDPLVTEWTQALGRLCSAVFRNVDKPTFLIEDFKEIMGRSGFFSAQRRKYVPSLIAEFGEVMKDFFIEIGLIEPEVPVELYDTNGTANNGGNGQKLAYCKICGEYAAVYEEGCLKCLACGYNKCG